MAKHRNISGLFGGESRISKPEPGGHFERIQVLERSFHKQLKGEVVKGPYVTNT